MRSIFQIYDIFPMREKNISSPPIQIYAHQGTIAAICLSNNGSKLATASDKGNPLWKPANSINIYD